MFGTMTSTVQIKTGTDQCPCCHQLLRVIEERDSRFTVYCSNGCCEAPLNDGTTGASILEAFVLLCQRFDTWEDK